MKRIYIIACIFISILFIGLLHDQIAKSVFEQDLLCFVPKVAHEAQGLSFFKTVLYVLSVRPSEVWFETPMLKGYILFFLSLSGPLAKNLIYFAVLIHFVCSILLYFLGRKLGLSFKASLLAGLLYVSLFSHFHAYMWPMGFHHYIMVFFTLLGLNLYLTTDRIIENGGNWRGFYIVTLMVNLAASFCRLSVLLLPMTMLAHILFCAKNDEDRLRKYDTWLPAFIAYLSYYQIAIAASGEGRIIRLLENILPAGIVNALT